MKQSKTTYGIEIEYGILPPPNLDVAEGSRAVVEAIAEFIKERGKGAFTRWDHSGMRPFKMVAGQESMPTETPAEIDQHTGRQLPVPSVDVPRLSAQEEAFQRTSNKAFSNGARYYVDHAHPEYATPECADTLALTAADSAGEKIVRRCAELAGKHDGKLRIFKNNTDGKGHAYGTHENYLLSRNFDIEKLAPYLAPFFVVRPILAGSGRVGIGTSSEVAGFQIYQRADFIENLTSMSTTVNRGILNTRDEPHSDPRHWRRMHYIGGDANCFPYINWLKTTLTALVLRAFEQGKFEEKKSEFTLLMPVADCRKVSQDLAVKTSLKLADGSHILALDLLENYLLHAEKSLADISLLERAALTEAKEIIACFRENSGLSPNITEPPQELADRLEWVAKYYLLKAVCQKKRADFSSSLAKSLDLQWCALEDRGFAQILLRSGKVRQLDSLVSLSPTAQELGIITWEELVEYFIDNPPPNTRAYFRGRFLATHPQAVAAANWHSIVIDAEHEYPQRICLASPLQWTRSLLGELFETDSNAREKLDSVSIPPPPSANPRYGNLSY